MWRSCLLVTSTTLCKNSFHCFYCFLLVLCGIVKQWRDSGSPAVWCIKFLARRKLRVPSCSLETILIIIAASPGNGCNDSLERMKHYENMCRRLRVASSPGNSDEEERLTIFIQSLNITTFDTWFGSYWTCDRSLKGVGVIKSAVSVIHIIEERFSLWLFPCQYFYYTYCYTTNLRPPLLNNDAKNEKKFLPQG